ncbi:MAG: acyl-CoA dehydrogenase family protein [Salinirussus sp.]
MEFGLSEEHRMIRQTVREFRENEMQPLIDDLDPEATHLPKEQEAKLRKKAKEQGLWAMGIPEEYGGGGLDVLGRVIVAEELVQHRLGLYNMGLNGIEIEPGVEVGSPEYYLETADDYHMEEFIQPAIEGEKSGAFALTEPAGGSDPSNMRTRAVKDGDEWVLNGEKRWITSAGYADFAVVFARAIVDGEDEGITAFMVDTDTEGWSIDRRIDVIRPKDPFEIVMDDMRVHDRAMFGGLGEGFELAASGVRTSRILYSAAHLGIARKALEMALEYAKERETFGKPLSERQSIRWMIADSAVDIHTARLAVYDCAWKADNDIDVRHEASMVKLHSSEMLRDVLDKAIQIHGGMGVAKDLPLERWYREGRIRRIGEGPSEIQRRTIARNLVKGYEPIDLLEKI